MKTMIIGGGAAGMMAAITAAEKKQEVLLLERGNRLGRKLAVTGNGRCNLSNAQGGEISHYHGANPAFALPALSAFPPEKVRAFFRSLGLITKMDPSGKIYPFSEQAGSVVDVLRLAVERAGVQVRLGAQVSHVQKKKGQFLVQTQEETLVSDALILACGGAAGQSAGGSNLGYALLQELGHPLRPRFPALVQLKTENRLTRPLKGVRAQAAVALFSGETCLAQSRGEVQFAEYGVSGPAIFEISRAAAQTPGCHLVFDFLPDCSKGELLALLQRRQGLFCEHLLTGILHNKLGRTILSQLGHSLAKPVSALDLSDLQTIARQIKACSLPVLGDLGMHGAQVTVGGADTAAFFPETLESRLIPGLYAAGELLDIDGDCGGYNLQWAWASGRLAGQLLQEEAFSS